jgi:hypothetical protein
METLDKNPGGPGPFLTDNNSEYPYALDTLLCIGLYFAIISIFCMFLYITI